MKTFLLVMIAVAFLGATAQANEPKAAEPTAAHAAAGCQKAQEDHSGHKHGKNCGHKAVKHGNHMDYEHDGHKHMAHGDHFDECKG